MVCPACGYGDNLPGANYCENCGVPLAAATAPTATQDPAAPVEGARATGASAAALPVSADQAETIQLELPPEEVSPDWTCTCGRLNPGSEEYCSDCGEARPPAIKPLAAGDLFAGYRVVAQTGPQTFTLETVAPDPPATPATLLLGTAAQIEERRAVLHALSGDPRAETEAQPEATTGPVTDLGESAGGVTAVAEGERAATAEGSPAGSSGGETEHAASGADDAALVPRILSEGSDPARGTYLVLDQPAGEWSSASQERPLDFAAAVPALRSLLTLARRAAQARRLLLLSPPALLLQGDRLFLPAPAAPALPLAEPLLANPAYVAPELRTGERDADPWRANAFAAGATAHALAGNALGFPSGWHALLAALTAPEPEARPESAAVALQMLASATEAPVAVVHRSAFRTDIGHHHPVNQDAGGVWTWQRPDGMPLTLAIVADGVSAGTHSEDAAALTVELYRAAFEPVAADPALTLDHAAALLIEAGLKAQQQVCRLPMKSPEVASATTLVAACVLGLAVVGIWCGDSRIYGVTPEGLRQLTRDHSWVNIMVDGGQMTLEQAKADRRAHVIARWLGYSDPPREDPGFDRFRCDLAPGDRLLLCSDGLYMYYDAPAGNEAELVTTIVQHGDDLQGAVETMVDTALARGGYDNITAVLVAVDEAGEA